METMRRDPGSTGRPPIMGIACGCVLLSLGIGTLFFITVGPIAGCLGFGMALGGVASALLVRAWKSEKARAQRAGSALRQALDRLEPLVRMVDEGVLCVDFEGRVTHANGFVARLMGRTRGEIQGQELNALPSLGDPELVSSMTVPLSSGKTEQGEFDLQGSHDRRIAWWSFSIRGEKDPTGLMILLKDVSEREGTERRTRILDRRLRQVQKAQSLQSLAASVGNEFNNLLLGISANAELLAKDALGDEALSRLRHIDESTERAHALVERMIAYLGRGDSPKASLDLVGTVREVATFLEASLPKKMTVHCELPSYPVRIRGEASELLQALVALTANASESLVRERAGNIEIRCQIWKRLPEEVVAETIHPPMEGPHAELSVLDNGGGMDEETIRRVFDPLFSTKGEGRGFGLAAVQAIIRRHQGEIRVVSRLDRGTEVSLYFPLVAEKGAFKSPKGSGTGPKKVLVVDDESMIRDLSREALTSSGFEVQTAMDGREALEIFQADAENIDLVVLDLMMPHFDGEAAIKALRRIREDVKIVVMSGYADERRAGRLQADAFLPKPFRLDRLRETAVELLGPSGDSQA